MNGRTALIAVSAATLLGAIYYFNGSSSSSFSMAGSDTAEEGVPGLEFKLSQISRNPPSLLVTLKNNNPSTPLTLLKWNTPMDPSAANLGLFKLIDEETGNEIPTDGLKVNRKMPPSEEDLVTVAPGTEEAHEVVMNKPWLPEKKPATYKVSMSGKFFAVWDKYGGDLQTSDLEAYSDSPFHGRHFSSNEVDMRVE
ncbi:uncharacterized protein N0V89_006635 [Didymosphaeria variabile]|uniref:Uncharacterized protein n=1 Tax=Didymosphaeria variabile TaxID=1932322 RepID=A0A9W9CA42_9PLEO|nr:uncharacterized protein N0V89_006635 [Didymosphaeria variabile]KAJ4351296.1 hypothetical protein N0V89_006635 [Didymosphaeria variabile]